MAENLKLRKPNFTAANGYFYVIEEDRQNLLQRTDDGNTAFSYPLDNLISYSVGSLEFDGTYFWSMEQSASTSVIIRRWKLVNYVCALQQTITLASGTHYWNSSAFSVEHYHDTLASGISVNGTTLYLTNYGSNSRLMNYTTTSGQHLNIHLGPNSSGYEEDVYVSTMVSGGGVTLVSGTQYAHAQYESANFYTNLWLFNNYNGTSSTTGALYKLDAHTGDYIKKYPSGAYSNINACTFYNVNSFTAYGAVDTLAFIKSTNMLFVDITQEYVGALRYYGSMVMANIQSDAATVIPVYDVAMYGQNVYRLQQMIDGGSSNWTYYSYQLSSLNSLVQSISLLATPAIIAANGISSSAITAVVKDQFLQPIAGRLVYFTDDNATGYVTTTPVNSDSNGSSQTTYKSGTVAAEVKITATVSQS